ncbi:RND transporter, partial [Nocardiopsis tropica]|nr:RND transporter [Nocardiopsis tropica]
MAEFLYRLGRACAHRAKTAIAIWLALLVAAGTAFFLFSGELEDSFSIPGTPTDEVEQLLSQEFSGMGGGAGTVVYQTEDGSAFTEEQQDAIADRAEEAAEVSGVETTVDPFATEDQRADQQQELEDGREELESGLQDLEAGQAELDAGRAQAEAAGMLDQAEAGLDAEQAVIDQNLEEIETGLEELERGEAMLEMASGIRPDAADGRTAR